MNADQLARRVAEHMAKLEGTGPAWDVKILDVREGYARISMRLRPDMLNGHGSAHGGMIFALADTAFAYACNSRNVATVAQSATIHFLSPGKSGESLIAEAREVNSAGRSGVYAVSVCGEDGRPVAEFQGLSRSLGAAVLEEERITP